MAKADQYETDILALLLTATDIPNIATNMSSSSPLTSIQVSLHTGDPGDTGTQGTSEVNYSGYARVATTRSTAGWAVASGSASPVAAIEFPQSVSTSTMTATHFALGQTSDSTGGRIFYKGTITPNINISQNVTPRLTTGSSITEA